MFTSNNQRNIIIILSVCVVALVLVLVYQTGYTRGLSSDSKRNNNTFDVSGTEPIVSQKQDGIQQEGTHMILGVVEVISGKEITLKDIQKLPILLTDDGVVDDSIRMVVAVTNETVIERIIPKSRAAIENDKRIFDEEKQKQKEQNITTPLVPPQSFTVEKITMQDIKIGDKLSVFTEDDVAKKTSFVANRVSLKIDPPAI